MNPKKNQMKVLIAIFTLALIGFNSTAQPDNPIEAIKKKDSCYLRYDAKGNKLTGNQRYSEWQCGKLLGIVDCNERLEYDEESDLVYLNTQNMENATGAGKPFSGTCETCHMNGILERRVTFVNGKENGIDTTYYQTGCPQVIRNHVQGAESGQWLYLYDSTQYVAWEMNYMLGELHGKQIYFNKNGDTTKWENYNNGLLHGVKRSYYPDSKINREVSYNNGVLDGKFKIYNAKGVIIEELNFKNGKKHEECKYFYDDGNPLKIEVWDNGLENGEFKTFFYSGPVLSSANYKKGLKDGWFIEYYPDLTIKSEAIFKKDVLIEEHKYDEEGRETYTFGKEIGGKREDDKAPTADKKKKKDK